jgi:hypothetical protein
MNDKLNIWMTLESSVSAVSSVIVLIVGIVAFIRNKNAGWLLLSGWCLFSLLAGVTAIFILPGQPGMVFAFSGVVASGLLVIGVCLLAFSRSHPAGYRTADDDHGIRSGNDRNCPT